MTASLARNRRNAILAVLHEYFFPTHSSKAYASHEKGEIRERGFALFGLLSHFVFQRLFVCCLCPHSRGRSDFFVLSYAFCFYSTIYCCCSFFSGGLFFAVLFVPGTLPFRFLSSIHFRLFFFPLFRFCCFTVWDHLSCISLR